MKRLLLIILFLLILLSSIYLDGEDWPCWRGLRGDGISTETNWSPAALRKGAKISWRANVGQGHSAVSIKNGLLYTQGSRSIEKNGKKIYQEGVFCFDAVSGRETWSHYYVTESRPYTGPRATPLVEKNRVYALGAEGNLLCLEAKTGTVIWEKNLIKERFSRNSDWGFCGSPLVVDDKLILDAGASGLALDKKTGAVIWKSSAGKCGLGTPVLTTIGKKKVVLINNDRNLYAVNVANGQIEWEFPWPYCDSDPVLVKNKIFLFGGKPGYQRCRALVNIADGKSAVSWPEKQMNISPLSWIAYKGYIYGITYDKKEIFLKSISLSNGEIQWGKKLEDWASLTISNGFIILIQTCGDIVILRASPNSYEEVARAKVWQMKNRQKYPKVQPLCCWTAPVLCNGRIYVRNTYGEIACIDVSI